jgi:hypothetical protein
LDEEDEGKETCINCRDTRMREGRRWMSLRKNCPWITT